MEKKRIDKNQLLHVEQLIELRSKYLAEPYSLHVILNGDKDRIKVEIVRWRGDSPSVLACMRLIKQSEELWEVAEANVLYTHFRGSGKLLYYLSMNKVYPAYISADFSGCSIQAKRMYDAFEKLDYVDSKPIFPDFAGTDILNDEFTVINRMHRFQFPRLRYLDDPIKEPLKTTKI